jgi:hypothetical protein
VTLRLRLPSLCGALQSMQSSRSTLMDNYEYVMYGRIFKFVDAGGTGSQVW